MGTWGLQLGSVHGVPLGTLIGGTLKYHEVGGLKGQNSAESFEGQNSLDTLRNHKPQQKICRIQGDAAPQ